MNSNNNLTLTSLSQIRPTLIPNILFVIFGSTAALFSLTTIYVIYRSKILRTKFFYLLLISVICDLCLGVSYTIVACRRIYRYYSGMGEVMQIWQCLGEVCMNIFSQIFALSVALALILERLAAIIWPIKYKQTPYKMLTLPLTLTALVFAMAQFAVHFENAWKNSETTILVCSLETITVRNVMDNLLSVQLGTSCTVVILNIILAIVIKLRLKKTKKTNVVILNATSILSNEMDVKIFKTITVMTAAHAFVHLGGRLCQVITNAYADQTVYTMTVRYSRSLVVFNSAVHFFLLMLTSGDFRKSAIQYVFFWNRFCANIVVTTVISIPAPVPIGVSGLTK